MTKSNKIKQAYQMAAERYATFDIHTDAILKKLEKIPISIHCWQGDDVGGFENVGGDLAGSGLAATGNYPGKARTIDELRADYDKALSLIPGKHRVNLHASYLDNSGQFVDRHEIAVKHFQSWIDWAKQRILGIDFNPTCFAHPKAADGFTLSHKDKGIRDFWIEHVIACRKISSHIGKQLNNPCVMNIWIPDGYKDTPYDRTGPRARLLDSLDRILKQKMPKKYHLDSVEPKLFGIGSESYTTGSFEFYLGYATSRQILMCLDAGHFHPTESIADKISSVLLYLDELLLHVSRPVRWDSDHVVTYTDELVSIAQEIVRSGRQKDIHIGLDYFDASINRVAAWVIGTRNMIKALLFAMLEPPKTLGRYEQSGDYTSRLAYFEELKTMPYNAVWDYYCLTNDVPVGVDWLNEIKQHEKDVLSKR